MMPPLEKPLNRRLFAASGLPPLLVTPTFPAAVLAALATVLMLVGALGGRLEAMAWGGALLFGLAVARLFTRSSIAKARAAGFEMLWREPSRHATVVRCGELHVLAELRNRSSELLVLDSLSPLSPPELRVTIEPATAVLPAHSAMQVRLAVTPLRIGVHGIQGLTVVVRNDLAAFETQLTFANPFVVEVLPGRLRIPKLPLRGGRGRYRAPAAKSSSLSGESLELRELREHQSGDPLRKVAWKSSARRGKLLVRDDELERHHHVEFVLDASVELWAGTVGEAALDLQIDRVAAAMRQALRRGDRVGLSVVASRLLVNIPADVKKGHERRLLGALAHAATTRDADRSGFDEQDVAAIVLEHLRPLEPKATRNLTVVDGDAIARLARHHLPQAPFALQASALAAGSRDAELRRYLTAFGLPSPARTTTDRADTDRELVETLKRLVLVRPDRIVVCSPWPSPKLAQALHSLLRRLKRARSVVEWYPTDTLSGLPLPSDGKGQVVEQALRWYGESAAEKGTMTLRRLGIHTLQLPLIPQLDRMPE